MSLCIAANNPGNFAIIAGDGRIKNGQKTVTDDHIKLTQLTDHVSIFSSGAQEYCELLRCKVKGSVNANDSIKRIADIVQSVSNEIFTLFKYAHPDYLDKHPDFCPLSTVLAYSDSRSNQTGLIEFCHCDGFKPHYNTNSTLIVRGLDREKVLRHLGDNFDPAQIVDSVFNTFAYMSRANNDIGGKIMLHIVGSQGVTTCERSLS